MAIDKIPFDEKGNMLEYVGYGDVDWRDNDPFHTEMFVINYERGRSAVRVILQSGATGAKYPMFISDFVDLAMNHRIKYGEVSATWVGCKKGQNYGIRALPE